MKSWYVIYTKSRQESLAQENLERQGYETCLPWIKRAKRRRGKWGDVIEPLFPRYLFARLDLNHQDIAPVRSTFGVTRLVMFGDSLKPVPDTLIEAIRHSADPQTGRHTQPTRSFNKGDSVVVASGPFEGLEGIFEAPSGKERVAILLDILGKSTEVFLKRTDIVPTKEAFSSLTAF